jgi:hypothetical protein
MSVYGLIKPISHDEYTEKIAGAEEEKYNV